MKHWLFLGSVIVLTRALHAQEVADADAITPDSEHPSIQPVQFDIDYRELSLWTRVRLQATSFTNPSALKSMEIVSAVAWDAVAETNPEFAEASVHPGVGIAWRNEAGGFSAIRIEDLSCEQYARCIEQAKEAGFVSTDGAENIILFSRDESKFLTNGGGQYLVNFREPESAEYFQQMTAN